MKGQVSVEFMALLSISLLGASILVTQVSERALQFGESASYSEAQKIAQKVSYTFDYVKASGNTSKNLSFSPDLRQNYDITVSPNFTKVAYDSRKAVFPNRYTGSQISLNSSNSYEVSYDEGFEVN